MKLTKIVAAVAVAAGLAASSSAMAFSLGGYEGKVKIEFGNLDSGTTGYSGSGELCSTMAGCDALSGITPAPGGIGSEDTWGIFSISRFVTDTPAATVLWQDGNAGEHLYGMFYGLADFRVTNYNTGSPDFVDRTQALAGDAGLAIPAGVKIWLNTTASYDGSGGAVARTALDNYPGVTSANLFLQAAFDQGAYSAVPSALYKTDYDSASIAGNGQGYLSVTGGSHKDMFDQDALTNGAGGMSDLFLTTTFDNLNDLTNWTASSTGQVKGNVPEPASLALFGIGLAGLGFAARRRKSA